MNNKISEILKKLTISILLLVFSFVLLTPTVNALEYDPKLRKSVIKPTGDGDPFGETDVIELPSDDQKDDISFDSFIISGKYYFYNLFRINIENVLNYRIIDYKFNKNEPINSQLR